MDEAQLKADLEAAKATGKHADQPGEALAACERELCQLRQRVDSAERARDAYAHRFLEADERHMSDCENIEGLKETVERLARFERAVVEKATKDQLNLYRDRAQAIRNEEEAVPF